MRCLLLISALLLSVFSVNAQYDEWMPAKAMTDSSHFNQNPAAFYSSNENILFWEQELNDSTTQICCRSFTDWELGDVSVVLYSPDIRFTNPQVINLDMYGNTIYYMLIYQTNEGNDIDLKYIIHYADGTISNPAPLSSLPGDDTGLCLSENNFPVVAWENKGKIWVSSYLYQDGTFSAPYAIDSVGCSSPAAGGWNSVSYLKENGDSTSVNTVNLSYNTSNGNWQLSDFTHKSYFGECSNLSSGYFSSALCMQNKAGTGPWQILINGHEDNDVSSPLYNLTQPVIAAYILIVDYPYHFLAYVSDSLGPGEIFAINPYNVFVNISNWSGEDSSPVFFTSFPNNYTCRINLFWKSEREGYTAIYYSYYDYLLGSTGSAKEVREMSVFPNPADHLTTITFNSGEVKSMKVFNMKGNEIRILSLLNNNGTCTATWDGSDANGNTVTPGSYIIVAFTDNQVFSKLIVRSK